jgi:23S rRNA (guanosine2251-2'-O)-methyltransferase
VADPKRNFVYGLHAIGAVLEKAPERLLELWMAELRDDARARDLKDRARAVGIRIQVASTESLTKLVGDVAHQGAVAAVRPLKGWDEHDLLEALQRLAEDPLLLILDGITDPHNLGACLRTADAAGVHAVLMPKDQAASTESLTKLVGDVVHQGAVAAVRPLRPWDEHDLMSELSQISGDPLLLVLDGVTDPHNLGACLRTADAAGVHALIIPKDRSAPVDGVARKVAAGAAEFVPVASVTNLARTLDLLKEQAIWVVGTEGEAPQTLYQADLNRRLALVLGAEGGGMRRLTRERCDFVVRIPMAGQVESLNVSVAAGVALFEARRQRGG